MSLTLKLNLDMVKMYLHTKNEGLSYSDSKAIASTHRHTDRQTCQTYRWTTVKLLPNLPNGKNEEI